MSGRLARACALVVLVLAPFTNGCSHERTPGEVVQRYFASLGRDPIRAASLVTGSFQIRHGLRHATGAQVRSWTRRLRDGTSASPAAPSGQAARTRAEGEILWLATQIKEGYAERAARLIVTPLSSREGSAEAEIAVRIASPGAPAFVQRFFLVRASNGGWQIDRIDQEGVMDASLADAFVASPTDATRRRLAAVLGVPAD